MGRGSWRRTCYPKIRSRTSTRSTPNSSVAIPTAWRSPGSAGGDLRGGDRAAAGGEPGAAGGGAVRGDDAAPSGAAPRGQAHARAAGAGLEGEARTGAGDRLPAEARAGAPGPVGLHRRRGAGRDGGRGAAGAQAVSLPAGVLGVLPCGGGAGRTQGRTPSISPRSVREGWHYIDGPIPDTR